jgi:hypothetical protein
MLVFKEKTASVADIMSDLLVCTLEQQRNEIFLVKLP